MPQNFERRKSLSEEYDLKKSEEAVGQLQPVIKDARGRIVDGLHRKEVNPKWRSETRKEIRTDEDYWKARAHLNFTRRNAQEARAEKLEIVNSLAEYYLKQGLHVAVQKRLGHQGGGELQNEVVDAIVKALRGAITESWIRHNIDSKYLQEQEKGKSQEPFTYRERKAIDALKSDKVSVEYRYGKGFVDRLQKEVKEETKEELLKDPSFQREIIREISKPQIVKPSEACPSGVCEIASDLPSMAIEPRDVMAERLAQFWKDNPQCHCKSCQHYEKCGVIR